MTAPDQPNPTLTLRQRRMSLAHPRPHRRINDGWMFTLPWRRRLLELLRPVRRINANGSQIR
jgi:hypothetical protein